MKKTKTIIQISSASLTRRFMAFIIDWYFSSMFALIPVVIAQSIMGNDLVILNRIDTLPFGWAMTVTICALIIYVLYFCVIPLRSNSRFTPGMTIGRKLLNIKVVRTDNKPLTFEILFIRDFIGVLILQGVITSVNIYIMSITQMITQADVVPYFQSVYYIVVFASTLFFLFGRQKQTFHDLISHTRMISHEQTPLSK
ncbi:MAG: RDD family protein [Erysipelotrichaceae bacterium]|nr:RDD family protein [Erysipelotrichaceae bacterium]